MDQVGPGGERAAFREEIRTPAFGEDEKPPVVLVYSSLLVSRCTSWLHQQILVVCANGVFFADGGSHISNEKLKENREC